MFLYSPVLRCLVSEIPGVFLTIHAFIVFSILCNCWYCLRSLGILCHFRAFSGNFLCSLVFSGFSAISWCYVLFLGILGSFLVYLEVFGNSGILTPVLISVNNENLPFHFHRKRAHPSLLTAPFVNGSLRMMEKLTDPFQLNMQYKGATNYI